MSNNADLLFRSLQLGDESTIKAWLFDYLCAHIAGWLPRYGLNWQLEYIKQHIQENRLVEQEWNGLLDATEADDSFVEIAHLNSQIIGIVWVSLGTDRYLRTKSATIDWIYVSRSIRRQKTAVVLLERAKAWMRLRGVQSTEVFVTESNTAAIRCYERAGLVRLDSRMVSALAVQGSCKDEDNKKVDTSSVSF